MKTKYKWIEFKRAEGKNDNDLIFSCVNTSGEKLGVVGYKVGWRQFVFNCNTDYYYNGIDFNFRCLEDIADFLKQLNKTKGCYKEKGNDTRGDVR